MGAARLATALTLVMSLVAACGDGGAGSTTTGSDQPGTSVAPSTTGPAPSTSASSVGTSSTAAAATTQPARPTGTWVGLLETIPAGGDMPLWVVLNDYESARTLVGVEVPAADANHDEIIEYLLALQVGPVADASTEPVTRLPRMGIADDSFGSRAPYDVGAWRTAYGIGVVDVDRTVVAGVPPHELIVWQGRIEPDRVAQAVASDPEWNSDLRTVEHGGDIYYAWGENPAMTDVERVGPVRPLGRGGCLYASDGIGLRAADCGVLEAALDARSGDAPSLADGEPLVVIAQALEDAGAYTAFLTLDVGLFAVGADPLGGGGGPGLLPYLAAGTGAGLDGDTALTIVALLHDSADDAMENAARLEQVVAEGISGSTGRSWSEFLSVVDVTTDGNLLVARLATDAAGSFWIQLVARRDTLLAWE
jgi:hypothetical protein